MFLKSRSSPDLKLTLLKVEIREDVEAYLRGGIMVGAGGIVAAVGFVLLNIAIACFVSMLFDGTQLSQQAKYGLGFVITGVVYLVAGAIMVVVMKNRLAKQDLVPHRSMAELERDQQWLKKKI